MIEFVLPQSAGEWLAWLTALVIVLVGLSLMLMPRTVMQADGLQTVGETTEGYSAMRGPFGGVYVGFGLAVMALHPQPLLYFALGAAFCGALIGRFLSLVIDRAWRGMVIPGTIAEVLGAFFPLAYATGLIA